MTQENSSFKDGIQYAWDSTSLKYAESCLQLYKYKMIDNWQPLQRSPHLLFGGWYASALEHFHKLIANKMPREEAIEEVVLETLIATWEYEPCEPCNGTGLVLEAPIPFTTQAEAAIGDCETCSGTGRGVSLGPWASTDNLKTRENLIRTIIWYFEQFADDSCKTLTLSDGSPMVEHSFKLEVDNGIVFCGHLDRGVEFAGKPYIQDQKTSKSTITANYFKSFNPDTQISGMYPFAGRAIFHIPFRGMMIDAAQIAVGFSRFERGFIPVDESSLNEWYDDSMYRIEEVNLAVKNNYFPRNRSSCSKYAGCEFREICSKSPHVRPNFLKANFIQGSPWDPMKSR